MTYTAYKYPQTVTIRKSLGGWQVHEHLFGTTIHHSTVDDLRSQVEAMEKAGWQFNDARAAGLPV